MYSEKVEDSFNVLFSHNIKNCKNVFLCVDLKDKEYYYMNKFIGKEKRESEIMPMIKNIFQNRNIDEYVTKLEKLKEGSIVQNMHIINSEKSIGDLITNSKNVINSFQIHNAEDIKGVINANNCKDIMGGYSVVDESQKVHE